MSYELIDAIYIKGLQKYGQYDKLNSVQIPIKSSKMISDLERYKHYKYRFLVDRLLFSSANTNYTNAMFITCNGLNEAKAASINAKLSKVLCVINLTQITH